MSRLIKIEGYDRYFISENGEIFSQYIKSNKKLSKRINKSGYYYVNLSKDGKYKSKSIHKLVAQYFVENPNNFKIVNHKDTNKLNNNKDNLEFTTLSGNSKHAFDNGLITIRKGENCNLSKLTEKEVLAIRDMKGKWTHREISEKFNVSRSTITQILNRTLWKEI
jgi:hypothetical protein